VPIVPAHAGLSSPDGQVSEMVGVGLDAAVSGAGPWRQPIDLPEGYHSHGGAQSLVLAAVAGLGCGFVEGCTPPCLWSGCARSTGWCHGGPALWGETAVVC
jgi:hypothetical protein